MDNLSPFSETPSPFDWLEPPETTSFSFNSPNTNEDDKVVPETPPPLNDGQIYVDAFEAMFGVHFVPRITEEYTSYMIGGVSFKRRRHGCSQQLGSKESTMKVESVKGMIKETASELIEAGPAKPTVKKGDVNSEKVSNPDFDMSKIDPFYHETLLRFLGDSVPNQDRLDIWARMFPANS